MKWPEDDDVARFVEYELARLDQVPKDRRWRTNAQGAKRSEVLAAVPNVRKVEIPLPVDEARVLVMAAKKRGLASTRYARMALAGALLADGFLPEDIPWLTHYGTLD